MFVQGPFWSELGSVNLDNYTKQWSRFKPIMGNRWKNVITSSEVDVNVFKNVLINKLKEKER